MIHFLQNHLCFEKLVKLIANIPYKAYHVIMLILVLVCMYCNCSSSHKLPMIGVLVAGFVVIIYLDIYSITALSTSLFIYAKFFFSPSKQ